jgi:hypothetical protein
MEVRSPYWRRSGEVVQYSYCVVPLREVFHQVGADEATAASDQDSLPSRIWSHKLSSYSSMSLVYSFGYGGGNTMRALERMNRQH